MRAPERAERLYQPAQFLSTEDADAIRDLFQSVFGQPMSQAHWQWKYANGHGEATGVRNASGKLVAHYGAMPRPILFFGQDAMAVQIGDVMVLPEARGVWSRSGPFSTATRLYLDERIGADRAHLLGFGFPSNRHMRLADKLDLYRAVGQVWEVEWPARDRLSAWCRLAPLDWHEPGELARLDRLWQTMREGLGGHVAPVRGAARWTYRFRDHPTQKYQVFKVERRLTGRQQAAFVLRPGVGDAGTWELMDWIAPPQACDQVREAALAAVARAGGQRLIGWFSTAVANRIQGAEGARRDIEVTIPSSARNPGPKPEQLYDRWWLTGGDTDFR